MLVKRFDRLAEGTKGTVLVPADSPTEWVGCQFHGFVHGHELAGYLPDGSSEGYWVPREYLKATTKRGPRVPKVGAFIKMTRDFDNALKGMVGQLVVLADTDSVLDGAKFDKLYKGHSLSGALRGEDVVKGQWVKRDSYKLIRKPSAPKPPVVIPKAGHPKLPEGLVQGKGVQVRTLEPIKTQGGESIMAGTWYGQAVLVSGRPTVLVSFGYGKVLILEADDRRIEVGLDD